jgi:hypothetical protein
MFHGCEMQTEEYSAMENIRIWKHELDRGLQHSDELRDLYTTSILREIKAMRLQRAGYAVR